MSQAVDDNPSRPTVLVIDDARPKIPESIAASCEIVRISTLGALDEYLQDVDSSNPPMAALIDVQFGRRDFGFAVLFRLRRSPLWKEELAKPFNERTPSPTERTVPILYTTTALADGELVEGYSYGDLHALLCAAACKTGILLCAKDHDLDKLEVALNEIRLISQRPNVRADQLVGVPHGELRFVQPVSMATEGAVTRKSLIRILLGNEYKRRLWESLVDDRRKINNTVNKSMRTLLREFRAAGDRPSVTLEGPGKWKLVPRYPLRGFVSGDIGRVARAWHQLGGNLLDESVIHLGLLTLATEAVDHDRDDDESCYGNPGDAFTEFARQYERLLSHADMADFAEWYLAQNWPE